MSSFKVVSFRGCIEINEGESNEELLTKLSNSIEDSLITNTKEEVQNV